MKKTLDNLARPSTFKGMVLSSLFGKTEMEQAVVFMIEKAIDNGDTWETPFNVFDFEPDSDELHRFSYLLHYDWMEEDGSGNHFVVGRGLVKRLVKRKGEING